MGEARAFVGPGYVLAFSLLLILGLLTSLQDDARPAALYSQEEGGLEYKQEQLRRPVLQSELPYAFQSHYARYESAQRNIEDEGQALVASQQLLNERMAQYAQQQQLAQQQQQQQLRQFSTAGTYEPSANPPGIAAADATPGVPQKAFEEESRTNQRLAKLRHLLKKSKLESLKTQERVVKVEDYVNQALEGVTLDVLKLNKKESDDIEAKYHDVPGPRGPPGLRGLDGRDAANGQPGFPGQQGPDGKPGRMGPEGADGAEGRPGPVGRAHRGYKGPTGLRGRIGEEGPAGPRGGDNSWSPSSYWCPGSSNKWTRLRHCTKSSCLLETFYNGEWGTVCDQGFTQTSAMVVCRGLGFHSGGEAKRRAGGKGPIWLAHVGCSGLEGDIADCKHTCGARSCSHDTDVGICCYGSSMGETGVRKMDIAKLTTVRELRKECQKVPTCRQTGGKKVVLYQSCKSSKQAGWRAELPEGEYASFNGRTCDNDQGLCYQPGCQINANQLRSMEIPAGLSVTLYTEPNYSGRSITYTGPLDAECLDWEGWGNRASSIKVQRAEIRGGSVWKMRIFSSTAGVFTMPNLGALTYVGSGTLPFVNLRSAAYFRKYVEGAPATNFAAQFFGVLKVVQAGMYVFCDTSDDGSQFWIDQKLVIRRRKWGSTCRKFALRAGLHDMKADMFQGGGPTNFKLKYSGPDTGGNLMLIRSESTKTRVDRGYVPKPSNFVLRIFSIPNTVRHIPPFGGLPELGKAEGLSVIDFRRNGQDFRDQIGSTPDRDYAWQIYGSAEIENAGRYQLCLTSNDGSRLFVDKWLTVDNDGMHGDYTKCGWKYLSKGDHSILVEGFQHDGGGMCALRYKGPDTGNSLLYMKARGETPFGGPRRKASKWNMQMFASSRRLDRMPNLRFLKMVGEKTVSYIDFRNQNQFQAAMPTTPEGNYAWAFYGEVTVKQAGVYEICSVSDDGSLVYVDDSQLVDNDGLHGPRKRCGRVALEKGKHTVLTDGFQRHGGAYMKLLWKGPDTFGAERLMPSDGQGTAKAFTPSKWSLRMYRADWNLRRQPTDLGFLQQVGDAVVPNIDFHSLQDFRFLIPQMPDKNYVWTFYGKVKIKLAGSYKFCITSDDGSFMYMGGKLLINNDGLHGDVKRCAHRFMAAGDHAVSIEGFHQAGGGVTMMAQYAGPDTGGKMDWLPSVEAVKPRDVAPSTWALTTYKIPWSKTVPDLKKVGTKLGTSKSVPFINFRGDGAFRRYVAGTPSDWFAWVFNGKVRIEKEGSYQFCSSSDDGSNVYVNNVKIVDNDGWHVTQERCGGVTLKAGEASVRVEGFEAGGHCAQILTYSGPDTHFHKVWPKSVDSSLPDSQ